MTGRRPLLPAVVAPWAAYVIARDFGEPLLVKARQMEATAPGVARQLRAAVEQMRESGRQAVEVERAADAGGGSAVQAGGGSAEVPQPGSGAGSERPPWMAGLSTGQAAARLLVTDRQVRNLIGAGVLVAVRSGRGWDVDEVSVAVELERRRSTA